MALRARSLARLVKARGFEMTAADSESGGGWGLSCVSEGMTSSRLPQILPLSPKENHHRG